MSVVYKYELSREPITVIHTHEKACVLHVATQRQPVSGSVVPFVWVLVDPTLPKQDREIAVAGTGYHDVRLDSAKYIGTLHMGFLVWHVFDFGPVCEKVGA